MYLESYEESARADNVALLFSGGDPMQRDNELLRQLMLEMEAEDDPLFRHPLALDAPLDTRLVYFHLRLLADEGLLEEMGRHGGLFRMTAKGHDFVQAVRDNTAWARTKATAAQVAGVSISMLKDIAIGYVRQELVKLGVPLG